MFGGGKVTWAWAYSTWTPEASREWMADNNVEFVGMLDGYTADINNKYRCFASEDRFPNAGHIDKCANGEGVNGRGCTCFDGFECELPVVCTKALIVEAIVQTKALMPGVEFKTVLLANEPWDGASYPQPAETYVPFLIDVIIPAIQEAGMKIASYTVQNGKKSTDYTKTFVQKCATYVPEGGQADMANCFGDPFSGAEEGGRYVDPTKVLWAAWSVHRYNTKYSFWQQRFNGEDSLFYNDYTGIYDELGTGANTSM